MMNRKLMLVDDDGKLLKKVDYPVNADSKDEVEQVDNETTNFMASKQLGSGSGYGTKSLLEQWKETAVDDDNDPYDDDIYDDHDNSICDNWDIKVRGRQPLSWLGRANIALDVGSELEGACECGVSRFKIRIRLREYSQPEPEVSYVSSEGNHNTLMYVGNSNKSGSTEEKEEEGERRTKRSKRSRTMDCTHLLFVPSLYSKLAERKSETIKDSTCGQLASGLAC
ncbi:hypothetical protein Tco_0879863 [Tanacetum coccineum]